MVHRKLAKMKKNILEIGSGQGFYASVLARNKNNKVYGIDISEKDVAISKKRYKGPIYKVMNAERLEFKSVYFDEIYALDILEHVDNLEKVLKETKRVLKKNGLFTVNIPYFKSEKWLLKIRPTFHQEIHHVRIFKKNELEKIMKKMGFSLEKKEPKDFLQHIELYVLFKRKIKSDTQLSIGSWRDNIFTIFLHIAVLYFNPSVVTTPLVFVPVWIATVPIGMLINHFGNKTFPRSLYYVFKKK